eukprot:1572172-Pyramimonas_sp.AAC.1
MANIRLHIEPHRRCIGDSARSSHSMPEGVDDCNPAPGPWTSCVPVPRGLRGADWSNGSKGRSS